MTGRVRLAVTLGDPRGIGPEIAAAALADGVDAEVTVIGAKEQIAGVRADRHEPVGSWRSGPRGVARTRAAQAGRRR